jgi:hypothetical protein
MPTPWCRDDDRCLAVVQYAAKSLLLCFIRVVFILPYYSCYLEGGEEGIGGFEFVEQGKLVLL